jgi:hypothetical protein
MLRSSLQSLSTGFARQRESDRALLHPAATSHYQLTMRPACCNYFDDSVFIRKSAVGVMFVRSSLSIESLAVQAHDVRLGTSAKGQQRQFLRVIAAMQRMLTRTWRSVDSPERSRFGTPQLQLSLVGMCPASASFFWSPIVIQVAVSNDYRSSVH